jgi:hypothetical protein
MKKRVRNDMNGGEMKVASAIAGIKTACIAALSLAIVSPSIAQAQNYPNRPIRMVLPFSPGGAAVMIIYLDCVGNERIL